MDTGGRRGRLARHSVHSYGRSVNPFLASAGKEGEVKPGTRAQLPKLGRRLLEVLSREELMEDSAKSERHKLIVRILADSGVRLGVLLPLPPADVLISGRNHHLRVRGKARRHPPRDHGGPGPEQFGLTARTGLIPDS